MGSISIYGKEVHGIWPYPGLKAAVWNGPIIKIRNDPQHLFSLLDTFCVIIYNYTLLTEEGSTMPTISHLGKTFPINDEGFLADPSLWGPEWVDYIRIEEDIDELDEDHWAVINILRDYYQEHGLAPMVRILSQVTGFKLKYIYELFPSGPGKGACKIAGLEKPEGCV